MLSAPGRAEAQRTRGQIYWLNTFKIWRQDVCSVSYGDTVAEQRSTFLCYLPHRIILLLLSLYKPSVTFHTPLEPLVLAKSRVLPCRKQAEQEASS